MSFEFAYEFGNGSDVGNVRKQNEDDFVLVQPASFAQRKNKGYLAIVCDGMGGAAAGDVASAMATNIVSSNYFESEDEDPRVALNNAIRLANESIFRHAEENRSDKGMGTTIVATVLMDDEMFFAHVGDSRLYLIRDGEIKQITEDHTMVQTMVQKGMLTEKQAENHPEGHVLSRSVGVKRDLEVDVALEPMVMKRDDMFLLCSDGLNKHVQDNDILQIALNNSPQNAVEALINLANERGGQDNSTVQIIKVRAAKEEFDTSPNTSIDRAEEPEKTSTASYYVLGFFVMVFVFLMLRLFNII
jgi:serine/threonine protein phosphatase PrpC